MADLKLIKPLGVQNIINKFCFTIGMIPSSYKLSLTYEEQILSIGKYLEETVIPALNNNAESVAELQALFVQLKDYIENYFDNLDVQNEINNKLDEMAQDGTLANIINQNILKRKISTYLNTTDLINDENLENNDIVFLLGKNNINDGDGCYYQITNIKSINSITLKNNLYATPITNLQENFYDEITYEHFRKNGTDFYLTTIPKLDKFNNQIDLVVEKDSISPLEHAQKNYTSFTCNGALVLGGDVGGGEYADTLVISNGEIVADYNERTKNLSDLYQFICFDENRNVSSVQANNADPQQMINDGVKQSFLVWYQCIKNGVIDNPNNDISNAKDDTRQILGVTPNGTILLLTNDGRSLSSIGTNLQDACTILLEKGVTNAWELDGGGSTSTIINTIKINRNHDDFKTKDRNISFTLNAKKTILNLQNAKTFTEISKAKQELNYQLRNQIHKYYSVLVNNKTNIPGDDQYGVVGLTQNSPNFNFINLNDNKISFNTKGDYLICGWIEIELFADETQKRTYFELFKNNDKLDNESGTYVIENIPNTNFIYHLPFFKAISVNNLDDVYYYKHQLGTAGSIQRGELEIIPMEYY